MRKYQKSLLDPEQCAIIIIDHEPQTYFGAESADRGRILNNAAGLVKTAQTFGAPVIFTTIAAKSFAGYAARKLTDIIPDAVPIDRTNINCWEDENLRAAVVTAKRRKLLLAGLWTEACVAFPALSMLEDGYEVYVVADACGGSTAAAHDMAISRMIQAGVVPLTWLQTLLEFQRDWGDKTTYQAVMDIIKEYGGAYGLGVEYVETMLPAANA